MAVDDKSDFRFLSSCSRTLLTTSLRHSEMPTVIWLTCCRYTKSSAFVTTCKIHDTKKEKKSSSRHYYSPWNLRHQKLYLHFAKITTEPHVYCACASSVTQANLHCELALVIRKAMDWPHNWQSHRLASMIACYILHTALSQVSGDRRPGRADSWNSKWKHSL